MQDQSHALYNQKTIQRMCSGIKINPVQERSANEWLKMLDSGILREEQKNYLKFSNHILSDILGYPGESQKFEEGNVEFSFIESKTGKSICFELKGAEVEDLFAPQRRPKSEHSSPIKQTWDYMGKGYNYGVTTNYRHFILLDRTKGYINYHFFDFLSIRDDKSKLKEFIAIFSKSNILENDFLVVLNKESISEERKFTNEFYKLYHETRLMLIKEYTLNGNISRSESIHYAQLFLNRVIFIFFAEDTGKLRRRVLYDNILASLDRKLVFEHSRYVSDTITNLFESLNKGSQQLDIFGFNGGLFREKLPLTIYFNDLRDTSFFEEEKIESQLKKEVPLSPGAIEVFNQYLDKVNPIIRNLVPMRTFDFSSELNVNILGHIFEQSITDLEALQNNISLTRKQEGIYYTEDYITDFICRQTIIPCLSKRGDITSVEDLIQEYAGNISELEKRFEQIKIIDSACGSGAFLIKAVDILLEIQRNIQSFKDTEGKYIAILKRRNKKIKFLSLTKIEEEGRARGIIQNNIFGIDKNEESVEITKLSLFLKLSSYTQQQKLLDLSNNIRRGDSIISDNTVSAIPFKWHSEFQKVFEVGGFDVVIGNPPYIPIEKLSDDKRRYFASNFNGIYRKVRYFSTLCRKGHHLLSKKRRNVGLYNASHLANWRQLL